MTQDYPIAKRRVLRGYRPVQDLTGNSRTQIWRKVRDGTFPAPIELGPNSVGWFEDEVFAWLDTRPRRTYGAEHIAAE
jgi:predicted DNA-binding transcriptional regulator AlpA